LKNSSFVELLLDQPIAAGDKIQMGKLLLGAFYSLMNRVTAKLLTNEKVGLVPGP